MSGIHTPARSCAYGYLCGAISINLNNILAPSFIRFSRFYCNLKKKRSNERSRIHYGTADKSASVEYNI